MSSLVANPNQGRSLSKTLLVLAAALGTVMLAYVTSTAEVNGVLVAFIIACMVPLLLVPTWIGVLAYFAFSAFSFYFKYIATYDPIVHAAPDLILIPILIRWVGEHTVQRSWSLQKLPGRQLVVLFLILCFVMMFSPMTTPLVALGGVVSYVMPIAFLPIMYLEFRDRTRIWAFLILTLALTTLGAVQVLIFAQLGQARVAAFGPGFAAAALDTGTVYSGINSSGDSYQGWIPLAVISNVAGYMIGAILLVALVMRTGGLLRRTAVLTVAVPAFLLLIGALVASGVRVTIAAVAIGILAVIVAGNRRAIIPAVLIMGALIPALALAGSITGGAAIDRSATLLNFSDASQSSGRTGLLVQIPQLIVNSPLGQGMGRIGPGAGAVIRTVGANITQLSADNMLLAILSELGVMGGVLLSAIAITFIVQGWKIYRRLTDPSLKCIALGCTMASLALTTTWYAGPTLMQAPGSIYFWGLAGLCFALPYVKGQDAA
jgi:hypothetical protein